MDPIELAHRVEARYRRYLKTTFYFRDPVFRASFDQALRDIGHLSKGPFLEATPVFKRGQTPQELFRSLTSSEPHKSLLSALRSGPLYSHQEEAIRRIHAGRNVVVATGTGSGKTEAFLYPVLLHLYKQFQQGELIPGVRALVLYPMNALANDQRDRLGSPRDASNPQARPGISALLAEAKSSFRFTYGQYTGDTPEDEHDSYRNARVHLEGRYEGELVLRKEMRRTPPHILLTNYSMLEYLLVRPKDTELFDNGRAEWWTFLVLDEAHQYRGSKGIEMAMLLRRLKRRLRDGGQAGSFRCIATSATIAGGEDDRKGVAAFASDLFGEPFAEEDVILGETEPQPELGSMVLPSSIYPVLHAALESPTAGTRTDLALLAADHGLTVNAGEDPRTIVGELLLEDKRASHLRRSITGVPSEVQSIADLVFTDLPGQERVGALSGLVELLLRAIDPMSDSPLLSARYHLFLRSLEGAFVAFWPEKKVYLDRQALGQGGVAFEVALCRECGQHYLVGKLKDMRLQEAIRDPGDNEYGTDFFRPVEEQEGDKDNGNDDEPGQGQVLRVCTRCGAVWPANLGAEGGSCGHLSSILVVMESSNAGGKGVSEREDQIPKCGACGYRAPDPVREVVHGTDGPHAVIATTLHQTLPADRRKVLAFADGRQEAAFFAWYLEKSYEDIRNRNLILRAARSLSPHTQEGVSLRELAAELRDLFRSMRVFEASRGDIELRREAWRALYREFLTDEPRIALDGVGLLHWSVKWPDDLEVPTTLLRSPWSLPEQQARDLLVILFGFMRRERAVDLRAESAISIAWEELDLQARQVSVQLVKSRGRRSVNSWTGKGTARAGFLTRILSTGGLGADDAVAYADDTLRAVWETVRQWGDITSSDNSLLVRVGDAHRLNPDWWRSFPISEAEPLFQCDTCGRLQRVSIRGVCPRHKCPGQLTEVPVSELEENHYRLLYDDDLPGRLVVQEHTAQIDKERAREYQRDFKQNRIDVLSCSTTFELGVDLGDLDTVFLRNVPPEAFNYAQRVGRAGRRSGFPGVAITYCRRAPHDLYYFAHPEEMLAGTTKPPALSLHNEKIMLRHVTATAFSWFFRAYPSRFESALGLFGDLAAATGVADFRSFLRANQGELEDSLRGIVPEAMTDTMGLHDGSWIERIAGDNSRFAMAEAEVCSDHKRANEFKATSVQKEDWDSAKWASDRLSTIMAEDVLTLLSRKAVIPKYGFPVDVVELDTHSVSRGREASEVALQRDLALAVAEFAPTSKLVANKKEWTSVGLKRVPGKEWPQKYYLRCSRHNLFKQWERGDVAPPDRCCEHAIEGRYIDPIFGFVTPRGRPDEPKRRPPRSFTTRPFFVGFSGTQPEEVSFEGIVLTRASPGKMVVLCEGRRGNGFCVCETCGAGDRHLTKQLMKGHKTPLGTDCPGSLEEHVSLGHEFPTDVVRLQFVSRPTLGMVEPIWFGYSLAYAMVEGAADVLEVPASDLNTTVIYGTERGPVPPIILYDNVPGGAGLVARLEEKELLGETLQAALQRVSGGCGCGDDTSCYGCLRSYRNQFAHSHLQRGPVKAYLNELLSRW